MKNNMAKNLMAVFVVIFICVVGISSHPYEAAGKILSFLARKESGSEETIAGNSKGAVLEEKLTMDQVKEEYVDAMQTKSAWINISGAVARALNMQGFYSDTGIYITDERYIISGGAKTTTDYEYDQMLSFQNYLDEKGIDLLYVNAPTKYTDDTVFEEEFGMSSYSNQNADHFLQRIKAAGIDQIDLREKLIEDGMDVYDMFYRTDHHWTIQTGLWASEKIAEALNEKYGYEIDLNIYNTDHYKFEEYKNSWLGEQGRKVAVSYVGLDDFTLVKPTFETDLALTTPNGTSRGNFDILVDESRYNTDQDVYNTPSWYYSYLPSGVHQTTIHNNRNSEGKKVLVLGDSYSQAVIPFLSLGVSDISTLVMRNYGGDLKQFIEMNKFDTVVMLYAQFMIGAHDNPSSANYNMFTLN